MQQAPFTEAAPLLSSCSRAAANGRRKLRAAGWVECLRDAASIRAGRAQNDPSRTRRALRPPGPWASQTRCGGGGGVCDISAQYLGRYPSFRHARRRRLADARDPVVHALERPLYQHLRYVALLNSVMRERRPVKRSSDERSRVRGIGADR